MGSTEQLLERIRELEEWRRTLVLPEVDAPEFGHVLMRPAAGVFVGNLLTGTLTTLASAANRVDITPFVPRVGFTIDQIGMSVSTGAAGLACGLIFDADAAGRPTTLLAQGANVDTTAAATVLGAVAFTFRAGKLYYVGNWTQAACTLRCGQTYVQVPLSWTNAATPARQAALRRVQAWGGAATNWVYASTQHTSVSAPFVIMRVA